MAERHLNFLKLAVFVATVSLMQPLAVFASTIYGSGNYGNGTYAGSSPTVTTDSIATITQTSAALSGTITSIGSTSPSVRGFVYGATTAYGATTTDNAGPFSTGAFSAVVSNLTCNTGYHFAAYASSTNGLSYGSDLSFTTNACPSSSPSGGGGGGIVGSGPFAPAYVNTSPTKTSSTTSNLAAPTGNSQTLQSSSASSSVAIVLLRNRQLNDVGADIRVLQKFLNAHNFPIATTGVGSAGHESTFFGLKTYKALKRFQKSIGIPATGYLGPLTRKAIAKF